MTTPRTPIIRTYSKLAIFCLTPEQHANTCNYWYTVTNNMTSHTAFTTADQLNAWLTRLNLTTKPPLPTPGQHGVISIIGKYNEAMHLSLATFADVTGTPALHLDNAEYTTAKITTEEDGTRTIHYLNCNLPREVHDFRTSHAQGW